MIVSHVKPEGWVDTGEAGKIQPSEVAGLVHSVSLEAADIELLRGPQGPQGLKGDTGATGPQGPQGVQGAAGQSGPWCVFKYVGGVLTVLKAVGVASVVRVAAGRFRVNLSVNQPDSSYGVLVGTVNNPAYNADGSSFGCVVSNAGAPVVDVGGFEVMTCVGVNSVGNDLAAARVTVSVLV